MVPSQTQDKQPAAETRPLVPVQRHHDAFTAYAAVHELGRSMHQPTA